MRKFKQVDVFGSGPFSGNPVAVVLEGEGISETEMQRFARWTNLSETTFLLPPTAPNADYRLRIFTPIRELPFAGHPTLGSAHAWLEAGGQPKNSAFVVQECKAGLIQIQKSEHLQFAAPPQVRSGPVGESDLEAIARALQIPRSGIVQHNWVDNGPGWVGVMLESAQAVLDVVPEAVAMAGWEIGVVGPYPAGSPCQFEVRALVGKGAVYEDPVTGSLNASLAQWMIQSGLAPERYIASQGTQLGRSGRVYVQQDAEGQVWIGGATVTAIEGTVNL